MSAAERVLVLKLDRELADRAGVSQLPARPADDARLVAAPDAPGVEPTTPGCAMRADVPVKAWPLRQGTVGMRIRASRRIDFVGAEQAPNMMTLVESPGIRVVLREHRDCPHFLIYPPGASKKPMALCRIAYLEPEKWYHFAISWNADTGQVDIFLNGWAQQRTQLPAWQPATPTEGECTLEVGGVLGAGADAAKIAVSEVELYAWHLDEARLRTELRGHEFFAGAPGIRQQYEEPLDLSGYAQKLLYEPDLSKPLDIVKEETLFDGDTRVREPGPEQWVLEGPAAAAAGDGQLLIDNLEDGPAHVVLWLPRVFPDSFLLEFDITIETADEGLAIVFFAARPRDDPTGSIFKLGLPKRHGVFRDYIHGEVNSYHVSYLAAGRRGTSIPGDRRTANARKNSGFWLVACGDDQIQGKGLGRGPHRVRILKDGNRVRVEANGRLSVAFDDDGQTYGPVWGDGYIGLRQMNHLGSARYSNLRVYALSRTR